MFKEKLQNILLLLLINGSLTFTVLFIFGMITFSFDLVDLISWVDLNTKNFFLIFVLFFTIFTAFSSFHLRSIYMLKSKNKWIVTLFKYAFLLMTTLFFSIISNLLLQYFQFLKNHEQAMGWLLNHKEIFYISLFFIILVFLFTFAIIGNIYISTLITTAGLFLLGFAHYNKLNLRIEPLYPSDFKQISHLKDVVPMVISNFSIINFIIVICLFILIIILLKYLPKMKIHLWVRVLLLAVTTICIIFYANFPNTFLKDYFVKSGVLISKWNPLTTYSTSGFTLGFISNISKVKQPVPKNYSKEKVIEIAKKYVNQEKENSSKKSITPNIIYLMNETFWDPTRMPNVKFSDDPMPNVRSLSKDFTSGYIYSPAFGGATANVEFEALTGLSVSFLNPGTMAYQEIVYKKPFIPSIVSDLETKGYDTLAIHPYNGAFYKRNQVYNTFGFNQFLDMNSMEHTEMVGGRISDDSLTEEIYSHLKDAEKPTFIHAVSMQNHMPYNSGKYAKNTIEIEGLPLNSKTQLEVYTEGVKQADAALKSLIDKIEKLDQPTIIVFWGDHLPILGNNKSVYKEAGFAQSDNDLLNDKLFSETPLVIYSNYDLKKRNLNSISPIYLATILYDMIGLEKPHYFNFLEKVYNEIPGLKQNAKFDKNQKFIQKLSVKQNKLLSDYKLLQYDLLIGKQYTKDILFQTK